MLPSNWIFALTPLIGLLFLSYFVRNRDQNRETKVVFYWLYVLLGFINVFLNENYLDILVALTLTALILTFQSFVYKDHPLDKDRWMWYFGTLYLSTFQLFSAYFFLTYIFCIFIRGLDKRMKETSDTSFIDLGRDALLLISITSIVGVIFNG